MKDFLNSDDLRAIRDSFNRLIASSMANASLDVSGLPKIAQGTPWTDANNVQRRAVAHVYRAHKASGKSPEEAAQVCGYTRTTLDTWERVFV